MQALVGLLLDAQAIGYDVVIFLCWARALVGSVVRLTAH